MQGAPECYSNSDYGAYRLNYITRKVDIWSLGCVFIEIATWVVRGAESLEDLRALRRQIISKMGKSFRDKDCFHDGEKLLQEVTNWIRGLRSDLHTGDKTTGRVLDMVRSMTRQKPEDRPNTRQLLAEAEEILLDASADLQDEEKRASANGSGTLISRSLESSPSQSSPTAGSSSSSIAGVGPAVIGLFGSLHGTPRDSTDEIDDMSQSQHHKSSVSSESTIRPTRSNTTNTSSAMPPSPSMPRSRGPHTIHTIDTAIPSLSDRLVSNSVAGSSGIHRQAVPMGTPQSPGHRRQLSGAMSNMSRPFSANTDGNDPAFRLSQTSTAMIRQGPPVHLTFEDAMVWYWEMKQKNSNKTAKLPHHEFTKQLVGRDHVRKLLYLIATTY